MHKNELILPLVKIGRILYEAPATDFKIFKADVLEGELKGESIGIKGNAPELKRGDKLEMKVIEGSSEKFGRQFELISMSAPMPTDEAGLVKYLRKNFAGIGEKKARSLIQCFGVEVVRALELPNAGEILRQKLLWTDKQVEDFLGQWRTAVLPRKVDLMLLGSGVTSRQVASVKQALGEEYAMILQRTPYKLTQIHGIGFQTADRIALKQGVKLDDPHRIWAGAEFALTQAGLSGHCYLSHSDLITDTAKLLRIERGAVQRIVESDMSTEAELKQDADSDWWLLKTLSAEQRSAEFLKTLRQCSPSFDASLDDSGWADLFASFQMETGIELTEQQRDAVKLAMNEKVMILTGNPGTGKTTILKAILFAFEYFGITDFQLSAPTGKAARRMGEATGRTTQTIHKMLGLGSSEEATTFSHLNPLPAEVVAVDEMSMVDISLFAKLVSSLQRSARLIMIGDYDQLASVGPGRVLQDLLESGLPSIRLTQPQRQAAQSKIIQAAHSINRGEVPQLAPFGSSEDVWASFAGNEDQGKSALLKVFGHLQEARIDLSRIRVLSPMKQGGVGVFSLNSMLQEIVNPPNPLLKEIAWRGGVLREGDSLIQLKNNYDIDLMNGEEVKLEKLFEIIEDDKPKTLGRFFTEDGRTFDLPVNELDMQHSWALTIHKSQGGEYDVVVLFCMKSQLTFYTRKMLYTGLTRAKKLAFVIGDSGSLARVVARNQEVRRATKLKFRLQSLEQRLLQVA